MALQGKTTFASQATKVQKELAKLTELGVGGFKLAVDSNHTVESLADIQEAAKLAVEAADAPKPKRAKARSVNLARCRPKQIHAQGAQLEQI